MELLKEKREEDRKRFLSLEKQFNAGMEAQREQMQNITANMEEMRIERETTAAQNQTLKEAVEIMHKSIEQRNVQITELQNQIVDLASRPPPPPPKSKSWCVIL